MNKTVDQPLVDEFVRQVKTALATEDEAILSQYGNADTWGWAYMTKPDDMNWLEFGTYSGVVGGILLSQNILKVDRRKHHRLDSNPFRTRVSRKWYNENRKKGE